jgi:hypothetical protein
MTEQLRERGLIGWAHIYFLLSFRWWLQSPQSFSLEGYQELKALPLWSLAWIPRWPSEGVVIALEGLTLLALAGALLAYRENTRRWALLLLWPVFLGKSYLYLLDLRQFSTFHHMHLLLVALILASGGRIVFVRAGVFLIYIVSGLGKLNDSWLEGAYFQSLGDGLPLFGTSRTLLWILSLSVIVLELVGPWLWFYPNRTSRKAVLSLFLAFHLYSGFIVGFHYTVLMIPVLLLAFYPATSLADHTYRFQRRDVPAWTLLVVGFGLSLSPLLLSSDERYTAEGRYFSMANMFDANRAVDFEARFEKQGVNYRLKVSRPYPKTGFYDARTLVMISRADEPFQHLTEDLEWKGRVVFAPQLFQQTHLRLVGDPYLYLYASRELCRRFELDELSVSLSSRLNGATLPVEVFHLRGPCEQFPSYAPLARNEWLSDE